MFGNDIEPNQFIYQKRRETVFLLLAGLFLGSMVMLNILGISRFIDLSKYIGISDSSPIRFSVAIGVLAYPITFLCTDFISEIYGRRRANMLVWVGLVLNIWVLLILWVGGELNAPDELKNGMLPLNIIDGQPEAPYGYSFYQIRFFTFGATFASMAAYMAAQFCDVHIFHFIKKKTGGKKLWLRNNLSTLTSQLVDSVAVILITYYYASALPINEAYSIELQLLYFVLSSYIFKVVFALLDTIPFYYGTKFLRKYLNIEDELA
ncbi:MAG: queuosine precursor transporter [Bacteroidetes bacterium]|nr:queuosine precursor transporter [Bacteroidota bacterium]